MGSETAPAPAQAPAQSLDEATGRDVKGYLTERLCDEQRRAGRVASVAETEPLVNGAIAEISRRRDDDVAAVAKPPVHDRELAEGEWYGEAGHSPRVPEAVAGEKVSAFTRVIGDAEISRDGKTARWVSGTVPEDPNVRAMRRLPRADQVRAAIAQVLLRSGDPEWLARFTKAMHSPCPAAEYERVIEDAIRKYGDPRIPKPKRIQVGGGVK